MEDKKKDEQCIEDAKKFYETRIADSVIDEAVSELKEFLNKSDENGEDNPVNFEAVAKVFEAMKGLTRIELIRVVETLPSLCETPAMLMVTGAAFKHSSAVVAMKALFKNAKETNE